MIVDAHLDLAYNALNGRDVIAPAMQQKPDKEGIPVVGLPDLRAGRVGLICGTIFTAPHTAEMPGYRSTLEAAAQGFSQLRWYQQQERLGNMSLVRRAQDLPLDGEPGTKLRSIPLMENADPIIDASYVPWWFERGVRIVGMAWHRTRYAGGTGAPGHLTKAGREMVKALDEAEMIHDVSHLAEESFWDLLKLTDRPVMASHSNCRSIINTDRQLSDEMIRAIVKRDGVIGINFYDRFLVPPKELKQRRATLADVMRHVKHICELAGDVDHVGIGTDFDGGLGREQIPREIATAGDMPKVKEAASRAGFTPMETRKLMSGNWLRFFRANLPR